MLRWRLPLALVSAQLGLGGFVFARRLPAALTAAPSALLLTLLLLAPVASAVVLALGRRLDRRPEDRSPAGDALVVWLLAFLTGAHVLVLGVVSGALEALQPALGLCVAAFLLGLAPLLRRLPWRSPFGLAHPRARADQGAWRRSHLRLARACASSAALSLAVLAIPRHPLLVLALLPVVLTAGVEAWRGRRAPE